jgi:dipeptidyl-peptidase-4
MPLPTSGPDSTARAFLRRHAETHGFSLGVPGTFTISPDGARVLFLRDPTGDSGVLNLYEYSVEQDRERCLLDVSTLDVGPGLDPKVFAARQRARIRASGVVSYAVDAQVRLAAVTIGGRILTIDVDRAACTERVVAPSLDDPRPDPTGRHIAYVQGRALRLLTLDTGDDRELLGARPDAATVSYGRAEFVAAEEMGRHRGYWWAPDGSRMLVARVDTARVAAWHLPAYADPATPSSVTPYPTAGGTNADVRLLVVSLGGEFVELQWDRARLPYVTSVFWSDAGPPLVTVQSRDQRRMEILTVDPDTGLTRTARAIDDDRWVKIVAGAPAWLGGRDSSELVWVESLGGAYRVVLDGQPLTPATLQVSEILHVGTDVLFTATAGDPTEVHVYTADRQGVTRVSASPGVHHAARAGDTTVLVSRNAEDTAVDVQIFGASPTSRALPTCAVTPPSSPPPLFFIATDRQIRCALLLPSDRRTGPLPVLLDPYGGPSAQRVLRRRDGYLLSQWFADAGFAVLIADGRGTPGRGPEWERSVWGRFAELEVADQVAALEAAAEVSPVGLDLRRVAIRGWSHGGYLATMAVLHRPDVFHAAVAVAAVSDWRLYDSHFTERHLGSPVAESDAYDRNSTIGLAHTLSRPLLLIHGLDDDNVHPAHTIRLSAALRAAGRHHDLALIPGMTHLPPTDPDRAAHLGDLQVRWIGAALERRAPASAPGREYAVRSMPRDTSYRPARG